MATTIKYGGETVASIEAGQSATLKCANLKMADDVVVETTIGGGDSVPTYDNSVEVV